MAADYYTLETFRSQIVAKGKVDTALSQGTFPDAWDYCPCIVQIICTPKRECLQRIGIFFFDPHVSLAVIEILYIRSQKTGFIRANQLNLIRLIKKGIIDPAKLEQVSF